MCYRREAQRQSRHQSIQGLSACGAPRRPNLGPQGCSTLICCWSSSKVMLGGSLGVWFGSWKCVCLDAFSSHPPVRIREKHHACFGGGPPHLCAWTGAGGSPTFLAVPIVPWASFVQLAQSSGLSLTRTRSRLHFHSL